MFVVFEGIDGSGKTTVSNRVAQRLRAAGISVEHLREGGKFSSALTQTIREFGRDARNLDLTPEAEFFLYVTRDVQLLEEMTRPALGRAQVVIADRFLYSAEILARFGRGLPEGMVRPVLDAAARGLTPDLVVLVDVDPHLARARRRVAKMLTADDRPPSRKGLAGVGMQHRLREGYRQLAAREPRRWVVVDNGNDLEATVDRVFALLHTAAREGANDAIARARGQEARTTLPPAPITSTGEALRSFLHWIDDRAPREPHVAAYFLAGLHGAAVDDRRRALTERAPEVMITGARGLLDDVSWSLREQLMDTAPAHVARSLAGVPAADPRAAALRSALARDHAIDVLASYDGSDEKDAWQLRERLWAEQPDAVLASMVGLDDALAWQLREAWLERRGRAAFTVYDNARLLCKSIGGLGSERAWELREATRGVAPIAALSSIQAEMNDDRSWSWRTRYLDRAPKAVFGTLRRSTDQRAWPMRKGLALTCKEVVDSIQDLDDARAWEIRAECAEVWPSTVVKSLGPLADTPRGQELIAQQLRQHPGNVSLLKHAAAVALGVHLDGDAGLE